MATNRFHTDRHGDSITVMVYTDRASSDIELLVNGKEVALGRIGDSGTCELDAPLPTTPPTPVHVTVRHPGRDGAPECTLLIDGVEQPFD
ncbi:hypothetical protein [Catenulispora subtropica]|uniref:Uncharacterized protein n=1 Tax=Catenulispora subtropica TaxID=450798 RepID=A0ABN2T5C2_9ACTN